MLLAFRQQVQGLQRLHCWIACCALSAGKQQSQLQLPAAAQAFDEPLCALQCTHLAAEYCSCGSLYDLLRRVSQNPELAATLSWQLRLTWVRAHSDCIACVEHAAPAHAH